MRSKFQTKVALPKKTREVHFNFPERVFSSTSIIQTFSNLDKGSLPISEVLLYRKIENVLNCKKS
jgi:hypothetical protein